ncbi:NAD(P)-dependent oxidoreductase, partial [Acinetobacter baumannii]|uniref:NAD(P)-dependent oxidoreductase n=1 Tax=Acinetobacter baumannii TaxID=470 RepID=UPI003AF737AC
SMVRGIANSKIGFGDLILLLSYFFKLKVSTHPSLHCPLTAENKHLFSHAQFEKMKSSSILINTARGELIDQAALVDALKNNKIAGAGLDTFSSEPPEKDNPLWELPNLVVTPHIGANTTDSRNRVGLLALEQIVSIWNGQLLNPRAIANWKLLNS